MMKQFAFKKMNQYVLLYVQYSLYYNAQKNESSSEQNDMFSVIARFFVGYVLSILD